MEECGAAGDESTGVGEKEVREIQIAFVVKKNSSLFSNKGSKCLSLTDSCCVNFFDVTLADDDIKSMPNDDVNIKTNANMALKGLTNVCPIAEKRGQFARHTYLQKVYGLVLVEFVQLLIKYYTEQSQ